MSVASILLSKVDLTESIALKNLFSYLLRVCNIFTDPANKKNKSSEVFWSANL